MEQQSLFGNAPPPSISINEIAIELNVSTASVRNWIKTGYLDQVGRGIISYDSFITFRDEVVGNEKLNKRANKSCADEHNHEEICAFIREKISARSNATRGDDLSDIYETALSSSHKNKEGIYYTPPSICKTFFQHLPNDKKSLQFCDPCCGSGNFLVAALDAGINPENIHGYDTDKTAVEIARKRIYERSGYETPNIHHADFLEVSTSDVKHFSLYDVIFTNPPWGKKLPKLEKEKFARALGHVKPVDTCALFLFSCISSIKKGGYFGLLLPDSFFNVSVFKEARETLLQNEIICFTDFGKPFPGLITKAKSFVAISKKPTDESLIFCETTQGQHVRSQSTFRDMPNSILNFSVSPEESKTIMHMLSIPHDTLAKRASWALGTVTGNNKKFVIGKQKEGFMPVYKGSDITKKLLKAPSHFIPEDLSLYQQVAPRHLYEADEKLLYKFISKDLVLYHDTKQRFFLNSVNTLIVDKKFPVSMKVLSDYLSSDLANWFFNRVFETHKVLRSDLEKIPIYSDFLIAMTEFRERDLLLQLNIEKTGNSSYQVREST